VLPTVYQGHYNPLFRQLEAELIPALRMFGLRLHCYSPLQAGLLADTPTPLG
jgi:aflatoxin B1 aldehyde reductase